MKEVVKGRAPDSMDTLVQQTESSFTAEVLHFPLPAKFRMPQIEAFDGAKDPVDHLNTYKNQMELHGYQDPVRCRAFAITLKGPALAWFNRLPPSSISSFRELSIAFVSHFIGARTYRKPSYHLLTIKQSSQESLRSYVQRFNAIKAIPSAYHMMIKFPTTSGVGMVRGDQRVARECYSGSMKQKAVDNIYLDELDMRDEVSTRLEPLEELESVLLDDNPEHLAYIGSKLAEDLKNLLTHFLRQNKDVFTWK